MTLLRYNLEDVQCPACSKIYATPQGRNSHLSKAKTCKSYRRGKLRDLSDDISSDDAQPPPPPPSDSFIDNDVPAWETDVPQFDLDDEDWPPAYDFGHQDFFDMDDYDNNLLPLPAAAGPGPTTQENRARRHNIQSRALDEEDDERVIEEHATAGKVKRRVQPTDSDGDTVMEGDKQSSDYFPFQSELDWRVAEWAVKESVGQKAFDRLLDIPEVVERLGLSFHNVRALHQKVDALPDRAGEWKTHQLHFNDKPDDKYTIHYRDPIKAIESLFNDGVLDKHMVYGPKKVFTDRSKTNRIYNEMCTSQWWHVLQSRLPKGATLAPIILATDKTQLTQFSGNKSAYPVYLTIGNIPKSIRRKPSNHACILIAYLSVDKISANITELEHKSRLQRIFHESMRMVLEPLKKAGKEGVTMRSCNGDERQVHPILVCYVADYPEQCLVTCSKYGTCPKCRATSKELADLEKREARTPDWTESVITAAKASSNGKLSTFHKSCMEEDVAGGVFVPFWHDFPLTDIHSAITPDILHQLYQGVFRHIISWCQVILGPKILDQRIRALPLAFGLRRFKNGISALAQISGPERKNMAKILLGCVQDVLAEDGVKAVKALLDFIYIAQYPTHSDTTLGYLQDALNEFHAHKDYFIDIGVRQHLNLPKIHSLMHYIESIKHFGTTDNYNTETFERLHIDFAKQGWRATNQRDEFPQMTRWLSRQEKVAQLRRDVEYRTNASSSANPSPLQPSKRLPISIAKNAAHRNRPISVIQDLHHAPQFERHLKLYLNSILPRPEALPLRVAEDDQTPIPFSSIDTYDSFRFQAQAIQDEDDEKTEIIRATPKSSSLPHGRFDTVITIDQDTAEATGLQGTKIGRIKVIFTLPKTLSLPGFNLPAPTLWPTHHLAYVEWYNRPAQPGKWHGMFKVTPAYDSQRRIQGSIIPLTNIRQSCMLIPSFPHPDKPDTAATISKWDPYNVLDMAQSFVVNNWHNMYSYQTIW